ncbi:hypothetical protein LINGRAHAP2_LOCUS27616 [Linum grandiflorum]
MRRKYPRYPRCRMFFRSSTGKDIGFRLEGEDPWVPKRKGCWVTESSNLYPQPDEDATKFLVTAKQPVVGISSSSSDDDGNVIGRASGVRSLKLCADNQYDMFVASFKPQGTSSFVDVPKERGKCCPDEGRIRKGWKDNNSQGPKRNIKKATTKERKDLAPKDREKREAALNPISWKQFPDKGKRSDGVRVGPVLWNEINKKTGGGSKKVGSAGQMGKKNSTKDGCWDRERPNLYAQPDEDVTKFLVGAKEAVIEISSSSEDDDGNVRGCASGVRSLVQCHPINQYKMLVASIKPQRTSSFLDIPKENRKWSPFLREAEVEEYCPNGGRIRKGGKDRNSQGTRERNIKATITRERKDLAAKDMRKDEAALNPISCKQFPGKRKREMDICNPVCKKRSDGVITKNEGGFCGGSKVRSAGQMGKNSTKNGYKEVAEKAGSIMRRPTGESKTSVRTTIKERKGPVPKRRKKSEAALDPLHCKMLPDKVQDVVQHIGSTKQPELGMNYQIVVKEEHPMCLGSDLDYTMDVIELDASMLPLGDSNPFVPADRLEVIDTEDVYDRAIMNPNSEFRLQLMEVLRQPYSDEEYNELLNEVSRPRQQPVNDEVPRPRSRRARPHPATSYLDQHKDFAKKLDEVQNHPEGNHHRREMLNLLRGFVYWLQHLLLYGAFEPWKDQLCLQELPR